MRLYRARTRAGQHLVIAKSIADAAMQVEELLGEEPESVQAHAEETTSSRVWSVPGTAPVDDAEPSTSQVFQWLCWRLGVTAEQIRAQDRRKLSVSRRQRFAWLLYQGVKNYSEVARCLQRDHTSVIPLIKRYEPTPKDISIVEQMGVE